jgi:hypothetical protein
VDILIPADDLSPAASALGIVDTMIGVAQGKAYGRLIVQGCAWLDRQARDDYRRAFAELAQEQCIEIVRSAEQAPENSLEGVFFRAVRDDAMEHYYTHPRVWPSLGYAGPPQPNGFPGFAQPPGG